MVSYRPCGNEGWGTERMWTEESGSNLLREMATEEDRDWLQGGERKQNISRKREWFSQRSTETVMEREKRKRKASSHRLVCEGWSDRNILMILWHSSLIVNSNVEETLFLVEEVFHLEALHSKLYKSFKYIYIINKSKIKMSNINILLLIYKMITFLIMHQHLSSIL